jgi:4-hydroxy-2-oxoheptanedioate aldolase
MLALAVAALAAGPKPKHINRAIELLEQGQPIYYTGSHSGTAGTFEQGVKDAQTYADYISYDMEHAPFDVRGLAEYMRGLAEGGPAKSGHRTPAVIVNVPVTGIDEAAVRANAWMFAQVLATGVHGILLCHADSPAAVRAFIEAVRFPMHKQGLDQGLKEGRRGVHGVPTASQIWGIPQNEYLDKAEPWPLNPQGELLLGVKLEDKYALENADEILKIPGVAFAEWGPGDMALSLGVRASGAAAVADPAMQRARGRVLAACKANKRFFLNSLGPNDVIDMIKEGVMIGPASQQTAEIGRKYTKREMPW